MKPTKEELAYWENVLAEAKMPANLGPVPGTLQLKENDFSPDVQSDDNSVRPKKNFHQRNAARVERAQQKWKRRSLVTILCWFCGSHFEARKGTKWCSDHHRKQAWNLPVTRWPFYLDQQQTAQEQKPE